MDAPEAYETISFIWKAFAGAVRKADPAKRATRLQADGYGIRTVQEIPGHENQNTAMIYTHVLNRGGKGVRSPVHTLQHEIP